MIDLNYAKMDRDLTYYSAIEKRAIINALDVLKQTCNRNHVCEKCPLYDKEAEDCLFESKSPDEWYIYNKSSPYYKEPGPEEPWNYSHGI